MARLIITPALLLGSYPTLQPVATSADVAFAAPGLASDGIGWINTGREILICRNTSGGALTVTISSVAHPGLKRTGDITTYSIGAGLTSIFGPFDPAGWNQPSDQNVYAAGSTTGITFAVIKLPSNLFTTV